MAKRRQGSQPQPAPEERQTALLTKNSAAFLLSIALSSDRKSSGRLTLMVSFTFLLMTQIGK
jgi:hypothetical protein